MTRTASFLYGVATINLQNTFFFFGARSTAPWEISVVQRLTAPYPSIVENIIRTAAFEEKPYAPHRMILKLYRTPLHNS